MPNLVKAKEVQVTTSGWSDFVFDKSYKLRSVDDLEAYVAEHGHLPDMPAEKELKEGGLSVSDMLNRQMRKIEELTLYIIQLKKENEVLRRRVEALEEGE